MCFITFLAIYQGKFDFGKFQQKLGLRSDPPPPVRPNAQLFPKINFDGSPDRGVGILVADVEGVGSFVGILVLGV